jgi:virginiamycin B lyase
MRRLRRLLIGALLTLVVGVLPATASASRGRPPNLGGWTASLPELHSGDSVAIGPDGAAWFGLFDQEGTDLAHVRSGRLTVKKLDERPGSTKSLHFDQAGNLWLLKSTGRQAAIVRRAPNGAMTAFTLPGREEASSLTIALGGDIWFTRGDGYGGSATVGWMTPNGAVTQIPLSPESRPASIVPGPDGAFWFIEAGASQVGRVTTSGEVTLFPLGYKVEPRQIVVGPDGALWFSENGRAGRHRQSSDRIGRITTTGEVSQLIPFGRGTGALAVDPRGFVWFTTEEGELSSISPSGILGARGCINFCRNPIESIAVAKRGALWFAAGAPNCDLCGGESGILADNEGTPLGRIPAGTLRPPSDVS